jgi:tetratricopeptide (TPR) repeat protein
MSPDLDRLNLLLSLRRYAEGEKAAREAIAANPEWASAYGYLAIFLYRQGRHLPAVRAARDCVGKDPHNPWGHAVRATALNRLGRNEDALAATDEAIRLDPTYAYAYQVRCYVLCAELRFGEARMAAIDGLKHQPTDEELLHWKGWAEYRTGRYDATIRTAEEGLRLHPDSASLRNVLGCTLMELAGSGWTVRRLRNYRRAEAALREAVRLDPSDPAYQDNRRKNALRCRRFILKLLLPALMVASGLLVVTAIVFAFKSGKGLSGVALMISLFTYIPGLSYLNAEEPWFFLSAPLALFGLPTVPLDPDEIRKGRRAWAVGIAALVGTPVIAWVLALASRL